MRGPPPSSVFSVLKAKVDVLSYYGALGVEDCVYSTILFGGKMINFFFLYLLLFTDMM